MKVRESIVLKHPGYWKNDISVSRSNLEYFIYSSKLDKTISKAEAKIHYRSFIFSNSNIYFNDSVNYDRVKTFKWDFDTSSFVSFGIDIFENLCVNEINENNVGLASNRNSNNQTEHIVFDDLNQCLKFTTNSQSIYNYLITSQNGVVLADEKKYLISFSDLGEILWQRSFEELGITRLDKFVGDAGEILVCLCDENLLLGLDKATGEVRWRVRQRVKTSNILLNKVSGNLYQFYNTWECNNTDDLAEGFQLIFLEINTQTGEILYDDDIFKHPKHQAIEGLGTNEDILNWRFHKALQWDSKIYFLLSQAKMGTKIAKVVAFDVILHQFTQVLDTLFYITANECWFMAEGKIFLTSKLMDKIEIEHPNDYIKGFGDGDLKKFELYFNQKLDSEKYNRVDSFRQYNHEEYYAFTKEEYLTIIDLEEN